MALRIEAGRWKGRLLEPLPRGVYVRPLPGRARGAVADMLRRRIVGARVLDLFAGSGVASMELLSRGAVHATMVERARSLARRLERQALRFAAEDAVRVVCRDVAAFLRVPWRGEDPFDVAFVDPPYADAHRISGVLAALDRGGFLSRHAVVVSHVPVVRGRPTPVEWPAAWQGLRSRRYGQAQFYVYGVSDDARL